MSKFTLEKDLGRHPMHYFALLCLQCLGLWGIFWFNHQPAAQFCIIVYMALTYVGWGVFHHKAHKDLHIKIITEYVLIALIFITLFSSLIFRS